MWRRAGVQVSHLSALRVSAGHAILPAVQCPFCNRKMRPGRLRSRGYATVWTPDESKTWLPPPFDLVTRSQRAEAVVVDGVRSAHRCESCETVVVPPIGHTSC